MREQQLKMKCNIVSDCKNRQTGEKGENSKRHFLQRSCVTDVTTVEEEQDLNIHQKPAVVLVGKRIVQHIAHLNQSYLVKAQKAGKLGTFLCFLAQPFVCPSPSFALCLFLYKYMQYIYLSTMYTYTLDWYVCMYMCIRRILFRIWLRSQVTLHTIISCLCALKYIKIIRFKAKP